MLPCVVGIFGCLKTGSKAGGGGVRVLGDLLVIRCSGWRRSSPAKWAFLYKAKPGGDAGGVERAAACTSYLRPHCTL